jgi:hypothetical protein
MSTTTVKKNTTWVVKPESPEGEYEAPEAAGDFILATDKSALKPTKETLERSSLNADLFSDSIRSGIRTVEAGIEVEAKAGSAEGDDPEYGCMLLSAIGPKTQVTSQITSKSNVKASKVIQDLTYTSKEDGGNSITITYTDTVNAGDEVASHIGNAYSVAIEDGVSTATQVKVAVDALDELVDVIISGTPGDAQDVITSVGLLGGFVNTTTTINIANGNIASFYVGQIVCVLEAGAYHVSPIASKITTTDLCSITLLIAAEEAFSSGVEIAKVTNYMWSNTSHGSVSVTKYVEDAITETAAGCKVSSFEITDFKTGAQPKFNFTMTGTAYTCNVAANPYAGVETYDSSLPTVALSALVYKDGVQYCVEEVGFKLENTLGQRTTTCNANGIVDQRVTEAKASGSLVPYKMSDSVADFTLWTNATQFSLFAYAANPTGTEGEFNQIWAIYLPKCQAVDISEQDKDGLLQNNLSYMVNKDSNGTIHMAFI